MKNGNAASQRCRCLSQREARGSPTGFRAAALSALRWLASVARSSGASAQHTGSGMYETSSVGRARTDNGEGDRQLHVLADTSARNPPAATTVSR